MKLNNKEKKQQLNNLENKVIKKRSGYLKLQMKIQTYMMMKKMKELN